MLFFGGICKLKYLLGVIPFAALVFGALSGNMERMSAAILDSAGEAVTLAISLCGIMCFWCGLMKVAEKAGIVSFAAQLLSPLLGLLFRGLQKGGRAMQLISMNITANILGLGNASTPLGISAMQAIAEEEGCPSAASDNMIMLTVLNTASLQIIPATAAALRSAAGAAKPMDILPCVWLVSAYCAVVAVAAVKLLGKLYGGKHGA